MDTDKLDRSASLLAPGEMLQTACLVEIHGPMLGRRYELRGSRIRVGRDPEGEIAIDTASVSRRHCTILVGEGGVALRDDGSTNGTWVNGVEIEGDMPLASGDLIRVGSVMFKFLSAGELGSIEARYHAALYQLTVLDGLTHLYNRRYLYDFVEREMARCARHNRVLSLILLDVDHFKQLNDTRGHSIGDAVLRELGELLRRRVRREECAARLGGEEFAIVLPETDLESARFFADMLRKLIASHRFLRESESPVSLTISAGLTQLSTHRSVDELVAAADARLYEAKRGGRDRVVAA